MADKTQPEPGNCVSLSYGLNTSWPPRSFCKGQDHFEEEQTIQSWLARPRRGMFYDLVKFSAFFFECLQGMALATVENPVINKYLCPPRSSV